MVPFVVRNERTLLHMTAAKRRQRDRGRIETLPSGSLRVVIFAGLNPVTGKRHYLKEVIPAGPRAGTLAEAARTRLLSQVDEKRNARTNATVD